MLRADREICEHDYVHGFVSPNSSHQHGIHTSRVFRVYLSMRSRPHFVWGQEVSCRILRMTKILYGHICDLAPGGAGTGPIKEEMGPITCSRC